MHGSSIGKRDHTGTCNGFLATYQALRSGAVIKTHSPTPMATESGIGSITTAAPTLLRVSEAPWTHSQSLVALLKCEIGRTSHTLPAKPMGADQWGPKPPGEVSLTPAKRQARYRANSVTHALGDATINVMAKNVTYEGALTPAQVVEGIAAALRNCRRLAADAATLLAAGSWPTAASLAILAVEEAGKVDVLRTLSITTDRAALKDSWKSYHWHQHKIGRSIGLSIVHGPLTDLAVLQRAINEQTDSTARVDQLKQSGFYSDCLPDTRGCPEWKEPSLRINEEQARLWVLAAHEQASKPDVKLREIELLVEHFGPVVEAQNMPYVRLAWLNAMDAEGLLKKSVVELQVEHADAMLGKEWRSGSPEFNEG